MNIRCSFVMGILLLSIVPSLIADDREYYSEDIDISEVIGQRKRDFLQGKLSEREHRKFETLYKQKEQIVLGRMDEFLRPVFKGSKPKMNHSNVKKLFEVAKEFYDGDDRVLYLKLADKYMKDNHNRDPEIEKGYYNMAQSAIEINMKMVEAIMKKAKKENAHYMRLLDEIYSKDDKTSH